MGEFLDGLEKLVFKIQARNIKQAVIGTLDANGNPVLTAPGRPDNYVPVRVIDGQEGSTVSVALNLGVAPIFDTQVRLQRDPVYPDQWNIVQVDPKFQLANPTNSPYNVPFHRHYIGSGLDDPVEIRRFIPGRVWSSGGLTINVDPFPYQWNGTNQYFAGVIGYDVSSHVPGSGLQRFLVVTVDPSTNLLNLIDGTPFSSAATPTYAGALSISTGSNIVNGGIALTNGQTAIIETNIYDLRPFLSAVSSGVVTSIAVTAPITNTGTPTAPIIGIANGATLGQPLLAGATAPAYGALNLAGTTTVSGLLPLAFGGSNADLSATGGTHKVVMQETGGGAFTVRTLTSADLPTVYYQTIQNNGSALAQEPKVNFIPGTNVTLTIADNPGSTTTDITINAAGSGNVIGPGSSTNRAFATWNGTAGTALFDNSTATLDSAGNPVFTSTGAITIPAGTTLQQPGSPTVGMLRWNSTTSRHEFYNGSGWINHVRLSGDTMTGQLINNTGYTGPIGNVTPNTGALTNLTITNGGYIRPSADGTGAILFTKADGTTAIVTIDSTNKQVGIAGSPVTGAALAVNGKLLISNSNSDARVEFGTAVDELYIQGNEGIGTFNLFSFGTLLASFGLTAASIRGAITFTSPLTVSAASGSAELQLDTGLWFWYLRNDRANSNTFEIANSTATGSPAALSISTANSTTLNANGTATNSIATALVIQNTLTTANAGAAGIGVDFILKAADDASAIGAANQVARLRAFLPTAAHLSRTGRSIFSVSDAGGERSAWQSDADGTGAIFSVLAGYRVATRVVTAAGTVAVTNQDYLIEVNKTVGAATTVNLPAGTAGQLFIIKDGKGDAATNNITITPAAGNIDGAGSYVMNVNYQSATIVYDGTQWTVN